LPVPLPEFPTLREFIEKAVAFGAEVKHTEITEGPDGPLRFSYLWIDSERFVEIPNLAADTRIPPDTVDRLARRLKIPAKDFWPPIEHFQWDKDDETDRPDEDSDER
jgi:hypothetical protein